MQRTGTSNSSDDPNVPSPKGIRFPIRWRWTLLVGMLLLFSLLIQFYLVWSHEQEAWRELHLQQEKLNIERLISDLKSPIQTYDRQEVEVVIENFIKQTPDTLGIYIHLSNNQDFSFGNINIDNGNIHIIMHRIISGKESHFLEDREWHIHQFHYDNSLTGTLALHFSTESWDIQKGLLLNRLLFTIALSIFFSFLIVYFVSKSMSKPVEVLSLATKAVKKGDYSVRLPLKGNDEFRDTMEEFNMLVSELEHKETIRGIFGRYLNPALVNKVFEQGDVDTLSERKDVTILFADMIGFTSFSSSASGDQVVSLLNTYYRVFHAIINHYDGHVDKFMGDAVIAVFNHPHENPDHPTQAALAGLAIQKACQLLTDKSNPVMFRVGLNRGVATLGNIGSPLRSEYTAIGDVVNVASRITGVGNADQVTMSHSTYSKMANLNFIFTSKGDYEVKGLDQTINCGFITTENQQFIQGIDQVARSAIADKNDVDVKVTNTNEST